VRSCSDSIAFDEASWDPSAPPNPLEQLACITPPRHSKVLPSALRDVITPEASEIGSLFPRRVQVDSVPGGKAIYCPSQWRLRGNPCSEPLKATSTTAHGLPKGTANSTESRVKL